MTLVYGSICSGIEAATVAWHPLGWKPAFFSEIEKFPRAVLAHHWPDVPIHGDFTTIQAGDYEPIDLLVGGTPCQSFSVAGLRGGLADDRGNLALEYLKLADRLRPRWLVWENVPGVTSSFSHAAPDPCPPPDQLDMECDGAEVDLEDEYYSEELHAFQCFLAGLSEIGYGFSYRILDAQYFGLAQRRERMFVIGYLGDWRPAAAVLFERESLRWNPAPSREAGAGVTAGALRSTDGGSDLEHGRANHLIAGTLCSNGKAAGSAANRSNPKLGDACHPLAACAHPPAIAYPLQEVGKRTGTSTDDPRAGIGIGAEIDPMFTLQAGAQHGVGTGAGVRRLTPRECERLQGFPDDYTLVAYRGKPAADRPRYKALGNSMAVPVMKWIGERIAMVETALAGTNPVHNQESNHA